MNLTPSSLWVLVLTLMNAVPAQLTDLDRGSITLALWQKSKLILNALDLSTSQLKISFKCVDASTHRDLTNASSLDPFCRRSVTQRAQQRLHQRGRRDHRPHRQLQQPAPPLLPPLRHLSQRREFQQHLDRQVSHDQLLHLAVSLVTARRATAAKVNYTSIYS